MCNLNILFRHQCFQWVTQWAHVIKVLGTNLLFALESLSSLNLLPVRISSHRPKIWSGCELWSICISPVMDSPTVQGVPHLSFMTARMLSCSPQDQELDIVPQIHDFLVFFPHPCLFSAVCIHGATSLFFHYFPRYAPLYNTFVMFAAMGLC